MRSEVSSRPAALARLADVDDDAAYARFDDRGTMSAAEASRVDGAASWVRGYDDDGASCVCDCGRDPSRARDEVQVCCTHCLANCCETPARCHPGPERSPKAIYYFFGAVPDHHMICQHLRHNVNLNQKGY